MRKIILIFCMLAVLCSCSGQKEVKPVLGGISFSAEVTYYNEAYGFDAELLKDGTLKAKITSPEELKDLNFTLSGEKTTVEYKGITYSPVEGSMPFSAVMSAIYTPLRELALSETALSDKEGRIFGSEGTGAYTLTVSPTGLPQKLTLSGGDLEIRFYNVSIKEDAND